MPTKKKAAKVKKASAKRVAAKKKSAAKPTVKKQSKTVKKTVKKAVKKTTKKAVKKAVKKTTKKAVKKVAKKVAKKVVKKTAKKVTKKTAKKKAVVSSKKTANKGIKKTEKRKSKAPVTIDYDDPQDHIVVSSAAGPLEFNPYQELKKEEYMSDEQVSHFRQILNNWKVQLMDEVDSTVVHLQQDAEAYADPLDRAAQEEGFTLELRTRDRERKLIKKIEQALDWIEEGVYGYCEDCGAQIGIRRLEARPTAAKCIDCKTYDEIREKQVGN